MRPPEHAPPPEELPPGRSIRSKLYLLIAVFVFTTFERVKVNGPIYGEIVTCKDLVADFMPPPESIVEAHMLSLQMVSLAGRGSVTPLIERSRKLRKEYEGRHKFWLSTLSD